MTISKKVKTAKEGFSRVRRIFEEREALKCLNGSIFCLSNIYQSKKVRGDLSMIGKRR
jgi:hypothetical protein